MSASVERMDAWAAGSVLKQVTAINIVAIYFKMTGTAFCTAPPIDGLSCFKQFSILSPKLIVAFCHFAEVVD